MLQNTLLMKQSRGPGLVKMCDFGYSKNLEYSGDAVSIVGTPAYVGMYHSHQNHEA